jgi:hypothetical protein
VIARIPGDAAAEIRAELELGGYSEEGQRRSGGSEIHG